MENLNKNSIRYREAARRVKKISGFYIHALVYLLVNIFIVFLHFVNVDQDTKFQVWEILKLPVFWGIGLAVHGMSIFLPAMILGSDWEEKKIRELMDKKK